MGTQPCPANSITYNGTNCACLPGYVLNQTANSCSLFGGSPDIDTASGVDYYAVSFPETIFSFDSIKKFTQSQAVFLEATLVMLLSWLAFCLFLRFMKIGDGENVWFKIRWWISRLDICFSTRHWLDDQKIVVKRKTELGGTFSIASWILFIGLFAALLYQIISKRAIEVHNVRAMSAPDLASFLNDVEFNITTVSSMSCSNLNGLGTMVTGNPGFVDQRVLDLTEFVNYTCYNTSMGPTLTLKCSNCRLPSDYIYIPWQFVDLPSNPAVAVGFQFNLSAKHQANKKHVSYVSGTLKNASVLDGRPITFRGKDLNILKFNLFPQIYHNLHDLKLIQPLFHEFVPGSFIREPTDLQSSLESSSDGLINTTLYLNFLSAYVVEIENKNILGPVSFLADLGGLYCISIGIFFYLLVQFEYRIKKLRHEDTTMRRIRSGIKARKNWEKLRKYVIYTWGCSSLDPHPKSSAEELGCFPLSVPNVQGKSSFHRGASSRKRGSHKKTTIAFSQKYGKSSEKDAMLECPNTHGVKSSIAKCEFNSDRRRSSPDKRVELMGSRPEGVNSVGLCKAGVLYSPDDNAIPLPPPLASCYTMLNTLGLGIKLLAYRSLAYSNQINNEPASPQAAKDTTELKSGSDSEMSQIRRNLQQLYDYNVMLREKLQATQTFLQTLASKSSSDLQDNQF